MVAAPYPPLRQHGCIIGSNEMANLTYVDKLQLEKLFGMGGGYVLNFSDRTFQEFIFDSVGIDLYAAGMDAGGASKAKRLRYFWKCSRIISSVGCCSLFAIITGRQRTTQTKLCCQSAVQLRSGLRRSIARRILSRSFLPIRHLAHMMLQRQSRIPRRHPPLRRNRMPC